MISLMLTMPWYAVNSYTEDVLVLSASHMVTIVVPYRISG